MSVIIKPHDYQIDPINAVRTALMEEDRALCVMATGLGKTIVSAFVVEELLNMGYRGLFLCHENYILEKSEATYREVIGNHINYKTFYGDDKDWDADTSRMLFASFQSFNNHRSEWYKVFEPDHFDFMVVDESHHGQAITYSDVINYFDCKKLGMTATPDREDGKDIRDIFGEEVVNIPLEVGIARGWLVDFEYHILSDGINNRKLKQILYRVMNKKERISVKQLNESIFISERTNQQRLVIEEYNEIKTRTMGKKTMIFCENILHAEHTLQYFENAGVIHSKRPQAENDAALKAFSEGNLQYLISVDKLNEGIDVPDVEVVVFLRATDSVRIWYQQTGRGARKIFGKTKLIVLDFVANLDRLLMIRELIDRIEDEVEKSDDPKKVLSKRLFDVSGNGFEFNFSDELVDLLKVLEVLKNGFFDTWQEGSKVCIDANVVDSSDYKARYRQIDLRLPSNPDNVWYDFPGWGKFLGKKLAPKDWLTSSETSILIGINDKTCKKYANSFRSSSPEWFKFFYIKTGKKVEHYGPKLIAKLQKMYKSRETAPDGWMNVNSLSSTINIGHNAINTEADKYRSENPGWFKFFWTDTFRLYTEYFSPELVEVLSTNLKRPSEPKEGWTHPSKISQELNRGTYIVRKIADKYRSKYPKWFKFFWNGRIVTEYYSIDLTRKIYDEFKKRPKAKKGWLTLGMLKKKLNMSGPTIQKIADSYRYENPGWFKLFWKKGKLIEYYHPKLVDFISQQDTLRSQSIPNGWKPAMSLSKTDIASCTSIQTYAKSHRAKNPDWFKKYYVAGLPTEHYHPELVKLIEEKFSGRKDAPEGWLTVESLTKEVSYGRAVVLSIVDTYRTTKPEWFKFYSVPRNKRKRQHLHPDLVELVKQKLIKPPKGWLRISQIMTQVIGSKKTIESISKSHRAKNPDWFKKYYVAGKGYLEHYDPKLVSLITKTLNKAPLGWMTASRLTSDGISSVITIKSIVDKYRDKHPEWFKEFAVGAGGVIEHYNPELVDLIKEETRGFKLPPPTGWQSTKQILLSVNAHSIQIRTFVDTYRKEHPEWFKKFLVNSGTRPSECYHPELVKIIKENF